MKFTLKADIEFYAEDIDDAFLKLSHHFQSLDDSSQELDFRGEMEIQPVTE